MVDIVKVKPVSNKIRRSFGSNVFDAGNYALMILLSFAFLYPFWYVIVISLSEPRYANSIGLKFWPPQLTLAAYREVIKTELIGIGFKNTLVRVTLGTVLNVLFTFAGGYVLSKKDLPFRGAITFMILFTMYFSGGLIPSYLLIRNLGLMETRWALILPGLTGAWNLCITRNFIMNIPDAMEESAAIDGANPLKILVKIIAPLSLPILAVIALFSMVGHWNAWFDGMIYCRERSNMVLQYVLRRILLERLWLDQGLMEGNVLTQTTAATTPETVRMAVVAVTCVPIVAAYPFFQKYFVKGIMMGALKG